MDRPGGKLLTELQAEQKIRLPMTCCRNQIAAAQRKEQKLLSVQ